MALTIQAGPAMLSPRAGLAAGRLSDGRLIVAGRYALDGVTPELIRTAELWEKTTGWRSIADLPEDTGTVDHPARGIVYAPSDLLLVHLADMMVGYSLLNDSWDYFPQENREGILENPALVAINDGRIAVLGGYLQSTAAGATDNLLYDPDNLYFASVAGFPSTGRDAHTATLLANGKVLVHGGQTHFGGTISQPLLSNTALTSWTNAGLGEGPAEVRRHHAAILLPNGNVLVAGGYSSVERNGGGEHVLAAEVYDPATDEYAGAGTMLAKRRGLQLALLSDGRVIAFGGWDDDAGVSLSSTEIWDGDETWTAGPDIARRGDFALIRLGVDNFMVLGGQSVPAVGDPEVWSSTEIYSELGVSVRSVPVGPSKGGLALGID